MQLLLFLSALLSGLGGVIAGDRAVERSQIERLGEAAAQQVFAIAQPSRERPHSFLLGSMPALAARSVKWLVPAAIIAPALRAIGIDTRRIE